jgi:hypothetical protein
MTPQPVDIAAFTPLPSSSPNWGQRVLCHMIFWRFHEAERLASSFPRRTFLPRIINLHPRKVTTLECGVIAVMYPQDGETGMRRSHSSLERTSSDMSELVI